MIIGFYKMNYATSLILSSEDELDNKKIIVFNMK